MNNTIRFTSQADIRHHETLEQLLYFNPQQNAVKRQIMSTIEHYGMPEVIKIDKQLRIQLGKTNDVQAIYAFKDVNNDESLVGVMIYYRQSYPILELLHLGVANEFTSSGIYSQQMLVLQFISRLRDIARRIKGIEHIEISYDQNNKMYIK